MLSKTKTIELKRVVVTGMGVVSPIGHEVQEFWQNLLAGKNGIDMITGFDTTDFATKFAGEIKEFDPRGIRRPQRISENGPVYPVCHGRCWESH